MKTIGFDQPPSPARRNLSELVNTAEPGLPFVVELAAAAKNAVELLPGDRERGESTLLAIQVTTRSPMGAIAYSTGGILVDHGWVRVLGGGHPRLVRSIATWNFPHVGERASPRLANAILVADDALGGFFAVNAGAFAGPDGDVFYLAPDTLRWEHLGKSYSGFLAFLFDGDLEEFYRGQRWSGWAREVSATPGDVAYSIAPFLWAKGGPIDERSRRAVPVEELWHLHAVELFAQLANVPDGGKVRVVVGE